MSFFEKDSRDGCSRCYGTRTVVDYTDPKREREVRCETCHGTGQEFTEIGEELIRVLRDHYGLDIIDSRKAG